MFTINARREIVAATYFEVGSHRYFSRWKYLWAAMSPTLKACLKNSLGSNHPHPHPHPHPQKPAKTDDEDEHEDEEEKSDPVFQTRS